MTRHQPIIDYFAVHHNLPITDSQASEIVDKVTLHRQQLFPPFHFSDIVKIVSEEMDVTIEQMKMRCRKKEFVYGRHLIWYFSKKYTTKTLQFLASYFNHRDHSTVINGIGEIKDLLYSKDEAVTRTVIIIEERLLNFKAPTI